MNALSLYHKNQPSQDSGYLRFTMVPKERLELSRLSAPAPKAGVSANSTTWAHKAKSFYMNGNKTDNACVVLNHLSLFHFESNLVVFQIVSKQNTIQMIYFMLSFTRFKPRKFHGNGLASDICESYGDIR